MCYARDWLDFTPWCAQPSAEALLARASYTRAALTPAHAHLLAYCGGAAPALAAAQPKPFADRHAERRL